MTEYQPTISPKTRDAVYITGLVVTAATGLGTVVTGVLFPEVRAQAAEIAAGILTATGIIVSGLGVAYRPGAR